MFGGVSRRADGLERQAANIELLAIGETVIFRRELGRCRRQDGASLRRKLATAGDEVGMQMSLEGESNLQSEPSCQIEIGLWIPARIDHEGAPVPQRNEIG